MGDEKEERNVFITASHFLAYGTGQERVARAHKKKNILGAWEMAFKVTKVIGVWA